MHKNSLLYCVIFGWFFISTTTQAANYTEGELNPYIGFGGYSFRMKIGQKEHTYGKRIVPEDYTGIIFNAGIRPLEYLGIEISYFEGGNDYEEGAGVLGYSVEGKSKGKFSLLSVKAIVFVPVPLTQTWEIFGSIGFGKAKFSLNADVKYQTPKGKTGKLAHYKKRGELFGAPLSVGIEWHPEGRHFSARAEYTIYTPSILDLDQSADMFSVVGIFHF